MTTKRDKDALDETMPLDGMPTLRSQPLFAMRLAVDALQTVGGPHGSGRRIGNIPGGTFDGERLRGTILPGGSDWQILRGDDAVQLDGRIILRCDDQALIGMTYSGLRHGPAEVMARLGLGETVDPASYYFRIVAGFATSDPRYEWLNRVIAVGIGERHPDGPAYFIHEII